jgi:transposase
MTFQPSQRFYAFGVANGKKEHYYFYNNKTRKAKKTKNKKKKKKQKNITAKMTLDFLKRLYKRYPKLLLVWDKAPNHKARLVQGYIETHDIKQEWFPTACPDENPLEQAWDFLKDATANTHYPAIQDYKKAVKKQTTKKKLTKMFKYLSH